MTSRHILIFLLLLAAHAGFGQSVGIGTTTPDTSAILDLSATDKGLLIPRMSTTQRLNLPTPATGLLVFDTLTMSFWYFNGSDWADVRIDDDANPLNEIQTISKTGNTVTLSDGGGTFIDANTTYDASDFVPSNQVCPTGEVLKGFNAIGMPICVSVDDADNNPTNELQTISKTGNTVTLSNGGGSFTDEVDDADNNPANELQTISKTGNTVTLSDGGGSFTDEVDDADNDPANEIETWSTLGGIPSGFADDTDDVNDADADPSNELQTISKSGDTIMLSNGGGSIVDVGIFEQYNGAVRSSGSTDDDFVFGMDSLPQNGSFYLENLLFFDESKSAFRAGALDNSFNWAPDSIGNYSFATGRNTKASGDHSVAHGWASFATGDYAAAHGLQSKATGSGAFSTGQSTLAAGSNALATGFLSQANGQGTFAQGQWTKADAQYASVFGAFNVGGGNPNAWIETDPIFEIGIGTLITPANALTVLKDGTVSFKEYAFPNSAGVSGQVLATDGAGQLSWQEDLGIFESSSGVIRSTGPDQDDFVFGADELPTGNVSDTLFFFDQSKGGAFRAGQPGGGDRWSPANIGDLSFAAGLATQASGAFSAAFGNSTDANGSSSFAAGELTNATGTASTAFGSFATASGDYSMVTGFSSDAGGDYSFAAGQLTSASGDHATATGLATDAEGNGAFATGIETDADAYASFSLGRYNVGGGNASTWTASDPVFEIGIGSSAANRANAVTVLKNGTVSFNDYTFPNADGLSGQVLATDGSGALHWENDEVCQFALNGNAVYNTGGTFDDFVFGLDSLPIDGVEHRASLFFFDESKAAFRAGRVWDSEDWNTEWLGVTSFAAGWNTKASGNYSFASGQLSEATGWASFAAGNFASASGGAAFALGNFAEANATNSMAIGLLTKADAFATFALGRYNIGGGNDTAWIDTDPIFEIGNGSSSGNRANAVTVLKDGRTGIGTHTPEEALSVVGTLRGAYQESETDFIEFGHGGNNAFINADGTGNIDIRHHDVNIMTLTQNQKVGIRTNNPESDLHIKHINSGGSGGLKLENTVSEEWARFYISSSNGFLRIYMDSVGIIGTFDDVSGAYSALSDRRLKENVRDLHFDWETFAKLQPLTYSFKADNTGQQYVGLVAQDVAEIYPELVTYDNEADRYLLDYAGFGVIAIKAIQEQQETIGHLNDALTDKDAEIQTLTERMDRLEEALSRLSEDE